MRRLCDIWDPITPSLLDAWHIARKPAWHERGIAPSGTAYYRKPMTTISLKLPEHLLRRLERESRARRTTKSSVVRECLEQQLPAGAPPVDLPELPPGGSVYDQALPILKKAWARNRKLPRDLATNAKYMKGFGE
jgi:hypothetical protein